MDQENLKALPYALVGAAGGIWKYYVKAPIHQAIENWVESHTFTQEEFDKIIGEAALTMFVHDEEPSV